MRLRRASTVCLLLTVLTTGCSRAVPPTASQTRPAPQAKTEEGVVYGVAGGQKLLVDVFLPAREKPAPAVILVHGGGWTGGSRKSFTALAEGLRAQGFAAFSVDYRLATATTNKYPAQIDDVQRAVRWVRANSKRFNIDPTRVGALGASAGGHLVALLGTMGTRDNSDPLLSHFSSKVACVVDFFGPSDFTVRGDPGVVRKQIGIVQKFLGKTQEEAPGLYRDASPVSHVSRTSAPFLIFHGTADPLVPIDQSVRLESALRKAGVDVKLVKMQGVGHSFGATNSISGVLTETADFLKKHLKP